MKVRKFIGHKTTYILKKKKKKKKKFLKFLIIKKKLLKLFIKFKKKKKKKKKKIGTIVQYENDSMKMSYEMVFYLIVYFSSSLIVYFNILF